MLKGEDRNCLCGEDMTAYMEKFADTFLAGKIRFETEILGIHRRRDGSGWEVEVLDLRTSNKEVLSYARIILCTGPCFRASLFHFPNLVHHRDAVKLTSLRPRRQSLRNELASAGQSYTHPNSCQPSIKFWARLK